jgi:hypothetical protein
VLFRGYTNLGQKQMANTTGAAGLTNRTVRYAYKTLEPSSIRLISLDPGQSSDPLSCRIRHVNLSSSPNYEAISYVWGDESNKAIIFCDGVEMQITQNLAAALRRFRSSMDDSAGRLLWTDSICINQNDVAEKEKQIPLMGTIYSQASAVLIWLGEEDASFQQAVECIRDLCTHLQSRDKEFFSWETPFLLEDDVEDASNLEAIRAKQIEQAGLITRHFGLKPPESGNYEALNSLLTRPWFMRAWTFQESWLAQKRCFFCGHHQLDEAKLYFAARALVQLATVGRADARFDTLGSRYMIEGRDAHSYPPETLLELLVMRRGAGCRYPQDMIYSLLGSVRDDLGMQVDYSATWQQVFADFAYKHIISSGDLSILGLVDSEDQSPGLPSWVPDWTAGVTESLVHRSYSNPLLHAKLGTKIYAACGFSPPVAVFDSATLKLTLSGFRMDAVRSIVSPRELKDDAGINAWSEKWLALKPSDRGYKATNEEMKLVIARTIAADLADYKADAGSGERWGPDAEEWLERLRDTDDGRPFQAWQSRFIRKTERASYVATEQGLVGIAPEAVRVGDLVCLILGGQVPLLLRRDGEDGQFRFIGEGYIHGIMDGEAVTYAMSRAERGYDPEDRSCLDRLHKEGSPLPLEHFYIK